MSRIGKLPVSIPAGVEIAVSPENVVTVKGKLGELTQDVDQEITVKVEDGNIIVGRPSDSKKHKAMHGLYRSLINNMVVGVSTGFEKRMELVGVGYRAEAKGQILDLSLGFSHHFIFELPAEIKFETISERGKNPLLIMRSHDKQLIGQVAAKIRGIRPPEPYKGKGIRFVGEEIRRKAGKTAAK
ncbi:MAG: 50S ribosomal protein L6 [Bacteroidales bacterium]|nr:50S ribosomal protein L6 [Bacteroidales bacterium]